MVDKIKVPEKHYLGMIKRQSDELPLGFMTPWGEDSSAKKRIATVDSWASQGNRYNATSKVEAQVIDNVPLSGFKFTASIRNSGYGGYDKWRIEDPRGFELEITSGNLASLMSVGMIDRGEIIDQCVWGRQGANNILLSTATDEYKEAVKNTQVFNSSASWSDVKLGDTITLQNTITGIWLGRQYPIYQGYSEHVDQNLSKDHIVNDNKMVHVIYTPNGVESARKYLNKINQLHLIASPKLSGITHCDTPLTRAQAELLANQYLTSDSTEICSSTYRDELDLSFGKAKYTLDLLPLNINSSSDLDALLKSKSADVFVMTDNETFGKLSNNNHWGRTNNAKQYIIRKHDTQSLAKNELREFLSRDNGYYRNSWQYVQIEYDFDKGDKFYNLQLTATTAEGNILKRLIK